MAHAVCVKVLAGRFQRQVLYSQRTHAPPLEEPAPACQTLQVDSVECQSGYCASTESPLAMSQQHELLAMCVCTASLKDALFTGGGQVCAWLGMASTIVLHMPHTQLVGRNLHLLELPSCCAGAYTGLLPLPSAQAAGHAHQSAQYSGPTDTLGLWRR